MNIEIKQIIEKAEAGDMKSQSFLASMYYQGTGRAKAKKLGISRDYQKLFIGLQRRQLKVTYLVNTT